MSSSQDAEEKRRLLSKTPKQVVALVSQGDAGTTRSICWLLRGSAEDVRFRGRLVEAGLVNALMDFMDQSSSHSFGQTVAFHKLAHPALWTQTLYHLVAPDHLPEEELKQARMLIARRIGPLAECMADPKEKFFKSREFWWLNLLDYTNLLRTLERTSETVPVLLQHPSVVDFCIPALFFDQYRPDITRGVHSQANMDGRMNGCLRLIRANAVGVLFNAVFHHEQSSQGNAAFMKRLASTRVAKNVAFPSALLDWLAAEDCPADEVTLQTLRYFVCQLTIADCFSKSSIPQVVRAGLTLRTVYMSNIFVDTILLLISSKKGQLTLGPQMSFVGETVDDKAAALAIEAGVLEMCLQMLEKHQTGMEVGQLRTMIGFLLEMIGGGALLPRTSLALRARESAIRREVGKHSAGPASEHATTILAIVDKAVSTAEGADADAAPSAAANAEFYRSRCSWCREALEPGKRKQCSGCKVAVYCSRECQVGDWKKGNHKTKCALLKSRENYRGGAHRPEKDENSFDQWRNDVQAAGERLFSENVDDIMLQATLRGLKIDDCVVILDFSKTPSTIEVKSATSFVEAAVLSRMMEAKKDEVAIQSILQKDGQLPLVHMAPFKSVTDTCITFVGYNQIPWSEHQKQLEQRKASWLSEIRQDPVLVEATIKKLTRSKVSFMDQLRQEDPRVEELIANKVAEMGIDRK